MYTSYIGKTFLKLYNKKNGTEYTAEQFFDEIFFNLFFTDESHLMHVSNSPFFQKPKEADIALHGSKSLAQLATLKSNIENDTPNMSIYVGAYAKDIGGTTSGQVSTINIEINSEEMYSSWIGEALAVGINGGFVMLIDNEDILWNLFLGWKFYRKFLNSTPNVKDKQIETWNGQWLCHCFSDDFDEEYPEDGLNINPESVQGKLAIPTVKWTTVILTLSKKFPNTQMTVYAYNLSQTNTTLGFINLYLHEIHEIYEVRDLLILDSEKTILSDSDIAKLEPLYNFKNACAFGTIGIKALEPAKLREYMPRGSTLYAQGKEFKFKDEDSYYQYNLFKIWIYAMLNKTELLQSASEIANSLIAIEKEDERGKKLFSTISKDVRESRNLRDFVDNLSKILEHTSESADSFKKCVENVLKMPTDLFPLFITLIRFEYAYQKSK